MADNEIVKALECCMGCGCKECPNFNENDIDAECCMGRLIVEALKLINRQKAEIERLTYYNENLMCANGDILGRHEHYIKEARIETIQEFAERLKDNVTYHEDECGEFVPWVDCRDINNLVTEMSEEAKHE